MTDDVDLQALLNPDWRQATFQTDVPDWLDDLSHLFTDLNTAVGQLVGVARYAHVPQAVLDKLAQLPEVTTDALMLTMAAAHTCRETYESYEIPKLG